MAEVPHGGWLKFRTADGNGKAAGAPVTFNDVFVASATSSYFASGNLGVATSSPATKLDVNGDGRFMSSLTVSANNATGGGLILSDDGEIVDNNDGFATHRFSSGIRVTTAKGSNTVAAQISNGSGGYPTYFTAANNFGIGTATPGYKLDVNGSIRGYGITDSSDLRLKKEVNLLEASLEKVRRLRGVTYFWKDASVSKERQIGLIAQEVEKVYPELVSTDSKGMKSVNYSHFVSPIIESVKALYDRIAGSERRIERLEAENQELRSALCEMNPKAKICEKRAPASRP